MQLPRVLVLDIISAEVKALELFEHFREKHPEVAIVAHSRPRKPGLDTEPAVFGRKRLREQTPTLAGPVALPWPWWARGISRYRKITATLLPNSAPREASLLSEREIEIVNLHRGGIQFTANCGCVTPFREHG